jgi:hypothetical protein
MVLLDARAPHTSEILAQKSKILNREDATLALIGMQVPGRTQRGKVNLRDLCIPSISSGHAWRFHFGFGLSEPE